MAPKFTPGPWTLECGKSGWFQIVAESGRLVVCSRNSLDHRADESLANARLIAAAPEMYDALSWIAEVTIGCESEVAKALEIARALVARLNQEV